MAVLLLALMLAPFCFNWNVALGSTLIECSGFYYLPTNYTGPFKWDLINEHLGNCEHFESGALYGIEAGQWEFYIEILRGWRLN